jgi:3-oxoacyl-[acyl-carrier protein] reductase
MEFDFTGKTVLITGGSRGIGRGCAELFSHSGANVVFTYKTAKTEAENTLARLDKTGNHRFFQLDVTQPDAVRQVFEQVMQSYPRLDVLINNAAVYIEHKTLELDYSEWQQRWHETIQTNLTGVAYCCYWAAQYMSRQGGGKIVNISSRGAFRGEPNHPAYGASKAGLNAFSQSLAQYLAPHNIIVGVVAPGYVETDMARDILDSDKGAKIKAQSPLNRVATPQEVARAAAVFASNGFEYMTGGIIDLNGASYLRS